MLKTVPLTDGVLNAALHALSITQDPEIAWLAAQQAADDADYRPSRKRRPLNAREGAAQWWREHAGEAAIDNVFGSVANWRK